MISDKTVVRNFDHARIQTITSLIEGYDGKIPFQRYLKNIFLKNKKFGSRDRKIIAEWCYSFFRLGKALFNHDFHTRLAVGYFLVHGYKDDLINYFADRLFGNKITGVETGNLSDRISQIKSKFPDFKTEDIFNFNASLSEGISQNYFALSMLAPPKVWIRTDSKHRDDVLHELRKNNINFNKEEFSPDAFYFNSPVALDSLTSFKKGWVKIQDRSSQLAGKLIPAKANEQWWDSCCGAGGKSLQLLDKFPGMRITATDKRESILKNFSERLSGEQKRNVKMLVADLELSNAELNNGKLFDGILADVPCTGSGTWSRTPEMLQYFDEHLLIDYTQRQRNIISNVIPHLKPGGKLIYITCSVFRAENEEIVSFISGLPGMKLVECSTLNGLSQRSDSMFYAIFERSAF